MPALAQMISRLCFGLAAASFAALAAQPARRRRPTPASSSPQSVSAMAATSAASPAPTIIASSWRRPRAPARRPGAPTFQRTAADGKPAVNARDRIGKGPWQNSKGVVIAKDVAELHSAANNLTKATALSEKGDVINGRGDTPNRHDVLTGSQADGTAFAAGDDRTCKNWTSSTQGAAMVGHADRVGLRDDDASKSWNTSHPSRGPDGGCSQNDLKSTGGDGLFYCFAAN